MGKLTKAQREWLEGLARRPLTARAAYRPAKKLRELGYAKCARIQWTPLYIFEITEAGRQALKEASQAPNEQPNAGGGEG